jgi:DNA-binding response OmpR family regulator
LAVSARQRAAEIGADAYVGKPFDLDSLLAAVRRFVA